MSTKFEQLLDFLVNEEMDKANELFHEIVVEKSRDIYENLIAEEEEEEEEEMDEAAEDDEQDESVDESADEEADESMDLEDSYMMDADDTGDATDDLGGEISASDDNFDAPADDEEDAEGNEDQAIFDIKNAIEQLEQAFSELEQAHGSEPENMDSMSDMDSDDSDDSAEDDTETMGQPAFEGRRVTREYVEKVGNDWEKSGSQKAQGKHVGSGSGDTEGAPTEGKSPVSSGKGKPTTGASAGNLNQGQAEGQSNTGTSPGKVNKGITPEKSEKLDKGQGNVPGGKMGVKNLSKVGSGYPNNNKTAGPVGAGTGDKAGQTSIAPETKKQFLPQYGKK